MERYAQANLLGCINMHCMMLQLNRFAVQDAVSSIGYNSGRSRYEEIEEYRRCRLSNSR